MKKVVFSIAIITISCTVTAQIVETEKDLKSKPKGTGDTTEIWKTGGTFNLNATQVALSNWAGGGQNSVSLQGILGLFANYSKDKASWDNTLDLSYGLVKQGKSDWFKNDDRIELNSKFGYQASKHWYYAALLNFRTQFADGYANSGDSLPISKTLTPAYTTFALGMDYKPNDDFTLFLSPATMKLTMVNDTYLSSIGAFGVDSGEVIRTEFGAYLKAMYKQDKLFGNDNLAFKTNLSLFTNYQDNPQNIDVTWDAVITAKVAKYLTVSLSGFLIYDHDIDIARYDDDGIATGQVGPATQFKQVLALGFAYKF